MKSLFVRDLSKKYRFDAVVVFYDNSSTPYLHVHVHIHVAVAVHVNCDIKSSDAWLSSFSKSSFFSTNLSATWRFSFHTSKSNSWQGRKSPSCYSSNALEGQNNTRYQIFSCSSSWSYFKTPCSWGFTKSDHKSEIACCINNYKTNTQIIFSTRWKGFQHVKEVKNDQDKSSISSESSSGRHSNKMISDLQTILVRSNTTLTASICVKLCFVY